jgi:hypothetical protein
VSNFLAVATVSAALSELIETALAQDEPGSVPGARVTHLEPGQNLSPVDGPRVNVYLYQLTTNPYLRDMDLPTRRNDGSLVRRPQASIDMHYLLTFYGSAEELIPERLAGLTMRALAGCPLLPRDLIRATIARPRYAYLGTSDLAEQTELVTFAPLALSVEELSRMWAMYPQARYQLSFALMASLVIIDGQGTPREALPVRQADIHVERFREPTITSVVNADHTVRTIFVDSKLRITGRALDADIVRVAVGGALLAPGAVTPEEILVTLKPRAPSGEGVLPGPSGLQVIHFQERGKDVAPLPLGKSNVLPVLIQPLIGDIEPGDVPPTPSRSGA